jgi:FAD:protein FMN transferase
MLIEVSEAEAKRAADAAIAEVDRIEIAYSRFRAGNITDRINRAARSGGSIELDAETSHLIDCAQRAYQWSEGLFDITAGALRDIWNDTLTGKPERQDLSRVLRHIGFDKIEWRSPSLTFTVPAMQIDLGGIAKEYAADKACEACRAYGVRHGLVDLGGDIAIIGPHPDGSPWRIGIRPPVKGPHAFATIFMDSGALATSGNYERFRELDGKRYGHIFDPRTGWPVDGLLSVTVAAEDCLNAGLASTIAILKGADGANWLRRNAEHFLFVDAEGSVDGSLLGR